MKKCCFVFCLTVFLLLGNKYNFFQLYGQSQQFLPVLTYSLSAITSSLDARSMSLGGASVATTADGVSPVSNMAKTVFHAKKYGTSLTYAPVLFDVIGFDIHNGIAQGFYNVGRNSFGAAFQFLSYGKVQSTDVSGNLLSTFTPSQLAGILGYARKIGRNFGLGVTVQAISQNLVPANVVVDGAVSANALSTLSFGGNLSVFYSSRTTDDLELQSSNLTSGEPFFSLALSIKNIGGKVAYETVESFQPTNISLGGAYSHWLGDKFLMQYTAEIRKLLVPLPPSNVPISQSEVDAYFRQSVFEAYAKAITELSTADIMLGIESYIAPAGLFVRLGAALGNSLFGQKGISYSAGVGYKHLSIGLNVAYQYTPWSVSQSSLFATLFWDLGGYIDQDEFDTFDLDFFSVEDLFPELE